MALGARNIGLMTEGLGLSEAGFGMLRDMRLGIGLTLGRVPVIFTLDFRATDDPDTVGVGTDIAGRGTDTGGGGTDISGTVGGLDSRV